MIVDKETILTLRKIIEEIRKPSGAWNNDPLIYRNNVIINCIEQAQEALEILDIIVGGEE